MSSQPQPQAVGPIPGFARVFHALNALKVHLISLQQGLELAQQLQEQQPDQQSPSQPETQNQAYPTSPPPAYTTPPSPAPTPSAPSSALMPSSQHQGQGRAHTPPCTPPPPSPSPPSQHRPHPHVYGHGYIQAGRLGSVPHRQILQAQINAARESIGPATAELNCAIAALRWGDGGVEREAEAEAEEWRELEEKMAELERKLIRNQRLECVVM